MEQFLHAMSVWVTTHIDKLGYKAIVLMMGIESACIPLPSEVIMPYGGYLVNKSPDKFSLIGMAIAGAVGCVVGSLVAYFVGLWGGRPFIERYGRYILIRTSDLDKADRFFAKWGNAAIFVSRLLPVVRTFISFPAGVSKMKLPKFVLYTFIGSLPWCYGLAYVGRILGKNWEEIRTYFRGADVVIIGVIVLFLALFIYHHVKPEKSNDKPEEKVKVGK